MDLGTLLAVGLIRQKILKRVDFTEWVELACVNQDFASLVVPDIAERCLAPGGAWHLAHGGAWCLAVPFPINAAVGAYPAFFAKRNDEHEALVWWDYDPAADVLATRSGLFEAIVWHARSPDGSRKRTIIDLRRFFRWEVEEVDVEDDNSFPIFLTLALHDSGRVLSISNGDEDVVYFCNTETGADIAQFNSSWPPSQQALLRTVAGIAAALTEAEKLALFTRFYALEKRVPKISETFEGHKISSMQSTSTGVLAIVKSPDNKNIVVNISTKQTLATLDAGTSVLLGDGQTITVALDEQTHVARFICGNTKTTWSISTDGLLGSSVSPHMYPKIVAISANQGLSIVRAVLHHYPCSAVASWTIAPDGGVSAPTVVPFEGDCYDLDGDTMAYFAPSGQLNVLNLASGTTTEFKKCSYFPMRVNLKQRAVIVADARARMLRVYTL